jgi:two-component system, chemotaxis family, chemotaxis protein CheY
MRVLVVDDSRAMRLILKKMLCEMGYVDIAEAENGAVAIERLETFDADLALVDWNMPVMNGLEFITEIRQDPRFDRLKIMMVTSESNPRLIYQVLKAGADEFAMKPITREIIEDKIALLGFAEPNLL